VWLIARSSFLSARVAAHGPIRAAIGYSINKHFGGVIVNNEGNDGQGNRMSFE
jgi:hypothetical protein